MIQSPQGFVVATECRKAAANNGFRRDLGEEEGWARFGSTTAIGYIALAAEGPYGPWFLAIDHAGVVAELGLSITHIPGPGLARYAFATLTELYAVLPRLYSLALTLPDGPLETFLIAVRKMPSQTEVERLAIQRVGQDIFRDRLLTYWDRRCPLTGIVEPELLRASHIRAWKDCETDAERLNVHNGLLLSALWDAAFDRGLVTFEDDGRPRFAPSLSQTAHAQLRWNVPIALNDQHRLRLVWHRERVFDRHREVPFGPV